MSQEPLVHIHMRWFEDTILSMYRLSEVTKDMDNPTESEVTSIVDKINELYTNGLLDDLVDGFYNGVEERAIQSLVAVTAKKGKDMDSNLRPAAVRSLCEQYLQEEPKAVLLLNTLISYASDMALIDEKREDKDFDYAEEMQELVHAMKDMNKDLESHDLLIMGLYAK